MQECAENKTWRKACLEIELAVVALVSCPSLRCVFGIEGSGKGHGGGNVGLRVSKLGSR